MNQTNVYLPNNNIIDHSNCDKFDCKERNHSCCCCWRMFLESLDQSDSVKSVKYLRDDFIGIVSQRIPQLLDVHPPKTDEVSQSPRFDLMMA